MLLFLFLLNSESDGQLCKKTNKRLLVVSLSMLIVITFIPAKETCYQMMISSQVTDENIQSAEDVIKKSVDYIFEKLKESD